MIDNGPGCRAVFAYLGRSPDDRAGPVWII